MVEGVLPPDLFWVSLGSGELEKDITSLFLTWNTSDLRGIYTSHVDTYAPVAADPTLVYQLLLTEDRSKFYPTYTASSYLNLALNQLGKMQ